jgi:SAM-dependent methyltransferase
MRAEPVMPWGGKVAISDGQLARMKAVPEFATGPYGWVCPVGALEYFRRRYFNALRSHCDPTTSLLADCGCGLGWMALSYLLEGGLRAIGIDLDPVKLRVASQFADILGVRDRIEFRPGSIISLPLRDQSVDVFTCIETLEHLDGQARRALQEIRRTTRSVVVVSTPNKCFPIVAHDTRLPFAHWLGPRTRRLYARLFDRVSHDDGNEFVSPREVRRALVDFELASRLLGFRSLREYLATYPHYLPYLGAGYVRQLSTWKMCFYAAVHALAGCRAFDVMPSLTGVFKRLGARSCAPRESP